MDRRTLPIDKTVKLLPRRDAFRALSINYTNPDTIHISAGKNFDESLFSCWRILFEFYFIIFQMYSRI